MWAYTGVKAARCCRQLGAVVFPACGIGCTDLLPCITTTLPASGTRSVSTRTCSSLGKTEADGTSAAKSGSTWFWAGAAAALGMGVGLRSAALAEKPPQSGPRSSGLEKLPVKGATPEATKSMTQGATKVDADRVHTGAEPPQHGGAGPTTGTSPAYEHHWPTTWGRTMPGGRPLSHPEDKKSALKLNVADLPVVPAPKASAPMMPPPVNRDYPVHMILDINTTTQTSNVSPSHKYTWWTFDGTVPGPVVRCRVGDVLEVRYSNMDADGIGHNIDFHSVTGPGGGAAVTYAEAGEVKTALFRMMDPGLFIYHCAAAPLPTHVANGMYGLVLVEPEEGLPPVDKEFYVIQSEVYAQESETPGLLEHNYFDGLSENPMYVVFNGAEGALTEKPLMVDQDDRVRIYFGNAGPNLTSAFHVIGATFDYVYREGDIVSPPARCVQTTMVPPGGSTVVEFTAHVPGNYTLLDHAIFRVDKGCVGFLKVRPKGSDRRTDIYDSVDPPNPCPGCKLHN